MKAPCNNLIVKIEKKYYDSITFDSGVKLHLDPMWHPEEWAMLTATVHSVPDYLIRRADYRGLNIEVKPGDKILMRYDVVYAYREQPDRATPVYKNMIYEFDTQTNKHEEYWLCDMQKVFAVIKDGAYFMQNDYVMIEPVLNAMGEICSIILPEYIAGRLKEDRGIVLAANERYGLKPGDKILFQPRIAQKYQIDTKHFWIIRQRHVLAKNIA